MEVPQLGVELELRLLAYTTTATSDLSSVFHLHRSYLNPLVKARDQSCILQTLFWVLNPCWATMGTPRCKKKKKGLWGNLQGSGTVLYLFFFFFFFFFCLLRAASVAYGGSQARGQIRAIAASLHHSHSNTGSETRLQHTPWLTAMLDP